MLVYFTIDDATHQLNVSEDPTPLELEVRDDNQYNFYMVEKALTGEIQITLLLTTADQTELTTITIPSFNYNAAHIYAVITSTYANFCQHLFPIGLYVYNNIFRPEQKRDGPPVPMTCPVCHEQVLLKHAMQPTSHIVPVFPDHPHPFDPWTTTPFTYQ